MLLWGCEGHALFITHYPSFIKATTHYSSFIIHYSLKKPHIIHHSLFIIHLKTLPLQPNLLNRPHGSGWARVLFLRLKGYEVGSPSVAACGRRTGFLTERPNGLQLITADIERVRNLIHF